MYADERLATKTGLKMPVTIDFLNIINLIIWVVQAPNLAGHS